jgi:hypothetical protein
LITVENENSSRCALGMSMQIDQRMSESSLDANRHPHLASYDARNENSNKHLIASMLKDSMLDFDNSRNDVVP